MAKSLVFENSSINKVSIVAAAQFCEHPWHSALYFDHISGFTLELSIISMMRCTGDWTNFRFPRIAAGVAAHPHPISLLFLLMARQFQCRTHMTWPQTWLLGHDCREGRKSMVGISSSWIKFPSLFGTCNFSHLCVCIGKLHTPHFFSSQLAFAAFKLAWHPTVVPTLVSLWPLIGQARN